MGFDIATFIVRDFMAAGKLERVKGYRKAKVAIQPGGGGTPICKGRGCSSEILNLTPKRDQSGRD